LGLAIARPDVRVIVIDGDGSLLMNLGSLATIGLFQPPNLVLVVMDNGEYATTGGQRTPTADGADLAAAARALRIESAVTVRTEEELIARLARLRPRAPSEPKRSEPTRSEREASAERSSGPNMIVAKVTESAPIAKPPLDDVGIKQRFMTAIGNA